MIERTKKGGFDAFMADIRWLQCWFKRCARRQYQRFVRSLYVFERQ